MKTIETKIETAKYRLQQIARVGNVAIYHRVDNGQNGQKQIDSGFEVIRIQTHNGYSIGGIEVEPSEYYPSSEQWGVNGWTCVTLLDALNKVKQLTGSNEDIPLSVNLDNPTNTASGQKNAVVVAATAETTRLVKPAKMNPEDVRNLPDEFTLKEVMEKFNLSYPKAFQLVKTLITSGLISEAGHVQTEGRGRKPVLYRKTITGENASENENVAGESVSSESVSESVASESVNETVPLVAKAA